MRLPRGAVTRHPSIPADTAAFRVARPDPASGVEASRARPQPAFDVPACAAPPSGAAHRLRDGGAHHVVEPQANRALRHGTGIAVSKSGKLDPSDRPDAKGVLRIGPLTRTGRR